MEALMAMVRCVEASGCLIANFDQGRDLLGEITDTCKRREISLGRVEALGAVERARFGFYDQRAHEYNYISVDEPLELVKLVGNISIRDHMPFVHAHVVFTDKIGRAYGGHLAFGTTIFVCECVIQKLVGPTLEREWDESTGLFLWPATE
jgi:predicted DNA-binding protein with PD1-like motif